MIRAERPFDNPLVPSSAISCLNVSITDVRPSTWKKKRSFVHKDTLLQPKEDGSLLSLLRLKVSSCNLNGVFLAVKFSSVTNYRNKFDMTSLYVFITLSINTWNTTLCQPKRTTDVCSMPSSKHRSCQWWTTTYLCNTILIYLSVGHVPFSERIVLNLSSQMK